MKVQGISVPIELPIKSYAFMFSAGLKQVKGREDDCVELKVLRRTYRRKNSYNTHIVELTN